MSSIGAGTMLAYLAGAAFFVCAVMAIYGTVWRVPRGFSLWTVSFAFVGVSCLLLADSGDFPHALIVLGMPALILLAAVLRLEGLRQYFGRAGTDLRLFLVPVAAVGLISVFTYVWDAPAARSMVTSVAITTILVGMTYVSLAGRIRSRPFLKSGALLFLAYGALWLLSGVHWLVTAEGFPLGELDAFAVVFFAGATLFEFFGLVGALALSARWNAERLEEARGMAEQERRRLADLVALLPDATFALDKEKKIMAWNQVAEAWTGVAASQVIGKRVDESAVRAALDDTVTLSEVLLDPTRSVPEKYRDVVFDGDSLSGEQEWHHPTMPEKWGHFWHLARLLRSPDGEVTGTIESVRDVTSRVVAEEALLESEERYRSLFDHSLDGILVLAPGGAVVDANPSACRMLGMAKEDICAAEPGSLVRLRSESGDDAQGRIDLGTTLQEVEFVRGDGSTFPADCMSVVWNDPDGHVRSFVQFRDVGERVEAQRILHESEASLAWGRVPAHMGRWEIDLVARSIWLSPGALRVFGISGHSPYFPLEAGTLTDLAEEPAALGTELARVIATGGSYDVEYFIVREQDRARRKVHSLGAAILGHEGAPVKVVGVTQDVTEEVEAPPVSPMELYAREHSDDQVYWVGSDGRIVNVNQAACTQLGYSREELLAMTIYQLNPTIAVGATDPVDVVKAAGVVRRESLHRTRDGRNMPVELSITYALYDGAEYKFVVARDISERKRLEENLQRTQLSLGRGGDAILWAGEDGQFAYATDSICKKLGFSRAEILARGMRDLDAVTAREWKHIWLEVLHHGSCARRTTFATKVGEEILVDVVISHVRHGGEDYALAVVNDASERKDVSAPSDADLSNLQHAELEAVGQLAGGIAHDFNNLLTAIIGYGDLILAGEDERDVGSMRRDAVEIRNAAERAAALTSQILAFARQQPLRPRKVRLGDLLSPMEPRLKESLTGGVELVMRDASEAGVVEVDTEQFERVVMNLVKNAQESMPQGGRVYVLVESVELTRSTAEPILSCSPACTRCYRWPTPVSGWMPPLDCASSSPSSRRSHRGRVPGWACPLCTASSGKAAAKWWLTVRSARARP